MALEFSHADDSRNRQLHSTFAREIQRTEHARSIPRLSESGNAGAVDFRLTNLDENNSVSSWIGSTRTLPHKKDEIQYAPRIKFVRICEP